MADFVPERLFDREPDGVIKSGGATLSPETLPLCKKRVKIERDRVGERAGIIFAPLGLRDAVVEAEKTLGALVFDEQYDIVELLLEVRRDLIEFFARDLLESFARVVHN